jgi:hypothetical protein
MLLGQSSPLRRHLVGGEMPRRTRSRRWWGGCTNWLRDEANCRRTGGVKPGDDSGWEAEVPLDLQWAHAMAPPCDDLCRRDPSDSPPILFAAVAVASKCVAEISS